MGLTEEEEKPAASRDLDGYIYSYEDPNKGPLLVVGPPIGNGAPIAYEEVERQLKALKIQGIVWDRVKTAVAEPTGKPVKICGEEEKEERPEDKPLIIDKSQFVFATVSDDGVSAKVTVVPPEDKRIELTMEDVHKVIADAGITYGIDEDKMAELEDIMAQVATGDWLDPVEVEVARGIEPEHGEDGRYEFFFDLTKADDKPKAAATEDGRVDYFAVQEVSSTKRGQAIARHVPPTMGVAGKSVKGEDLPARDGVESPYQIGRGVARALGNESILVADVDGQVKTENNLIEVLALYDIPGDVDLSTGSIDFIGTVLVHGNVQPGFKIMAGEDVVVDGVVDDAEIHAKGKVTVKGGVLGQGGKAKIVADGNISGMYFQNCHIETKGTLESAQYIRDCHVTAFAVKAMGKRGQVVGGEIVAETEVNANTIGSSQTGTHTSLIVGESVARRNLIVTLTEQVKTMEEELEKAKKALLILNAQAAKGALPADRLRLKNEMTRQQLKLTNDLKGPQEELQKLLAEEEEAKKTRQAKVSVIGTLYPGVKVKIRNAQKNINEEMRYCTLMEKGSDIKVGPYK